MTERALSDTVFEIRTDPYITTSDGMATIEDVRELQDVVDDEYTGDGKTVVVMDSGIDDSHPVFDDTDVVKHVDVVGGGESDDVGHGTACAGLIAQLAPDVELISLRIFGSSGQTDGRTVMQAYQWLLDNANDIDLVNMSWGARSKVQQIDDVHNRLVEKGVDTVVAAGNTGGRGGSPATAESAFSAGAVDENGSLTRFSSYNPNYDNPDVCGVGKNVKLPRADGTSMGSVIDDDWVKASGTSFSSPIVCSFVAQLLEKRDDPSVVSVFESTARDIEGTPEDGAGIADYADALSASDEPTEPDEPEKPTVCATAWSFAGKDVVYVDADWLDSGKYEAVRVDDGSSVTIEFGKPS